MISGTMEARTPRVRSRNATVAACTVWLLGVLAAAPARAADEPVSIAIPAQPLAAALNALAVQANVQMLFEQAPVAGLNAPAVSGAMTVSQAMQQLLAGTALQFRQNADGTVLVSPKPVARAAARRVRRVASPVAALPAAQSVAPVPAVLAEPWRPWRIGVRATYLDPANHSDPFVWNGGSTGIFAPDSMRTDQTLGGELDVEYAVSPRWSFELALSAPHRQELRARNQVLPAGPGKVDTFRLAPDFLTAKFHLLDRGAFRPYVGAGVNTTTIDSGDSVAYHLARSTVGWAAQAGFDVQLGNHWVMNVDAKWARVRPILWSNGAQAEVRIDPLLYGIGIGYRFGGSAAPTPRPVAPPPPAPAVTNVSMPAPAAPPVPPPAPPPPKDEDGDGVPDSLDRCPGTPAGLKVDANGCEIEELVLTGVNFETDSARLTERSGGELDDVVKVLRQRPDAKAEVRGYTDDRGSATYNQRLSDRRARAVVDYLVGHGVSAANLSARGFGKDNPVASNATDEGRARNRRVTVQFMRPQSK